jgi:hypothetical protein
LNRVKWSGARRSLAGSLIDDGVKSVVSGAERRMLAVCYDEKDG